MELSEARGRLIAIGGGDIREGDAPLLKEFVKLARGAKARIVVMTVATDDPAAAAGEYRAAFKRLGLDDVKVVDVSTRQDAADEDALKAIEQATGLFFTGGDQLHITSLVGGTEMQKLIHRRYERGLVIGGTSAGAAMMSNSMIVSGEAGENPKLGGVEIGPGMDLIVGAMNVLSDGHKFNLHSREPVVEEKAKRAKSSNSDGGAGASGTGKKRAARPAKTKRKQ